MNLKAVCKSQSASWFCYVQNGGSRVLEKEETWKAEAIKHELWEEDLSTGGGEKKASQADVMNDLIKEK